MGRMIRKTLLIFGALLCLPAPAWAACAVTNLQVKDNAAVTAAVPYADDGAGASNCSPQIQIKQGGNVLAITAGNAAKVDGSASTQPVSAASLPLPTGAATAANQATVNTWASGTLGAMSNYGTSPGAVLVPGVNASVTASALPAGAATSALQTTINTTLGSPYQAGGALPLPSGAATSANQSTEIASLASIVTNTGAAIPAGTASIGTLNTFAETAASSGVLKGSAGTLYTISIDAVTATADLKLLLFNSTTLPADGTVTPYKCVSFKGDGTQASFLLSWAPDALSFSTGISAAVSSSTACTTKTNVTATISGQVQ
jgi:hypothetical protein